MVSDHANRLEVSNLTVARGGGIVLSKVAFTLTSGVTVLLGENGVGKTTLLKTLVSLLPRQSGQIVLTSGGEAVIPTYGYQPQSLTPTGLFTVETFVEHVAWLHRVGHGQRAAAVRAAIEAVDLGDKHRVRLDRLSGGEVRRACIAQAIVHKPQVVLLDEPSAGLDPVQHAGLRILIRALAANHLVLLSTHQVEDVITLSDNVIILKDGEVACQGSVEGVVGPEVARSDVGAVSAALVKIMGG